MSNCRLNKLLILYVHSSKRDTLDLVTVAKEFIGVNSQRMSYFGNFNCEQLALYEVMCFVLNWFVWFTANKRYYCEVPKMQY